MIEAECTESPTSDALVIENCDVKMIVAEIVNIETPLIIDNKPHSTSFSILHLDAEKVLGQMGKYGRYQMFIYFMSNIGYFMFACETLIMSLIAVHPSFECRLTEMGQLNNSLLVIDQCTVMDQNSGLKWECGRGPESKFYYNNTDGRTTLASEYDLVCSREYWSQHGTSLFMIGGMVTTPILIQLADRYGRRFTFLIPLWLTVLSNIACSVSPSYIYFLIFRFLAGLGTAGIGTIGFVLMIEGVAPSFRSITPLFSTFVWVGGYMTVGFLHLFIHNWRWLYFVISAPGLLSFAFYWLLPESLHWLITNNKTKQVNRYIKNSSKMNKREIVLHECLYDHNKSHTKSSKKSNKKVECILRNSENKSDTIIKAIDNLQKNENEAGSRTFIDMFKSRSLVFHLILHCYVMVTMNFTYWALSLFSVDLHNDKMIGYFLSGVVELPAGLVSIFLLIYFGRRTVTFCALFAQSLAMFATVFFPGKSYFSMIFPLLAKIFNSVAWTSEPLLLGEMSPTSLRNTFYGSISFVGEIGSVLAPYLNILKEFHESAAAVLICVMSLISALAVLCSPETKDRSMPQDIANFDAGPVYKFLF